MCCSGKPAIDGLVQVENDMLLTKDQIIVYAGIKNGRSRRAAVKDNKLWPKGIVYYTFSYKLGNYLLSVLSTVQFLIISPAPL